ncbi:MAG TPA: sulfur carrier protein ThiS [Thermomicrobiales bacterium]|nr:sulfur carrier protein ThiS [Thermomicrobiales bacterium]
MNLIVNQQPLIVEREAATVADFLRDRNLPEKAIVVAINGDIVAKTDWPTTVLKEGDDVEIVRAVSGGDHVTFEPDPLVIAGRAFSSRLFLGTGKYPDTRSMTDALAISGTEMVTVAIRYMNLDALNGDATSLLDELDLTKYHLLPNTAGAYTTADAVKMARLARAATGTNWIKLEVIGDQQTLWPDVAATIEATKLLVAEGFVVLPYTSPNLVAALRLEEAGAATVMPLASPIGSGQGMQDWTSIQRIVERISVPVVVDAGIGVPSDAALAMEIGADAVLVNTAVARANDPVRMALAMKLGVEAGRHSHLAGRIARTTHANASSPTTGVPLATAAAGAGGVIE